jgi:hypothetical protein
MAKRTRVVIGGVDTHGRTHHAAVIDQHGRLLTDAEFGAHTDGYRQLLSWPRRHGRLGSVGVEGTGTYGAGLTRFLLERGVQVLEADRPNRRTRRPWASVSVSARALDDLMGKLLVVHRMLEAEERLAEREPGGNG